MQSWDYRAGMRLGLTLLLGVVLLSATWAQTRTITGTVMEEDTEEPIPGVNVRVKETGSGAVTDIDGKFTVSAESGHTLVFSFIGFVSQEVLLGAETTINISLVTDVQSLQEVIVVGYGQTQNKTTVSTAIHALDSKVIEDRPIARPEQAIQGSVPAVVVVKESGSPGAPLTVRMRGVGTAGDATPLILLNGVQVPDMNFINPNDIGNITILKDAASSAIYGARGGNGVILIETKKGQSSAPRVTFSGYYGIQSLASEGDYLTTAEYAEYYNNSIDYLIREGLPTTGGRGKFTDQEIAALPNESWIRAISQDAAISDMHIGVQGGDDRTQYYVSGGLFSQEGIIGKTSFDRRSFSVSVNSKLKENLTLSVLGSFAQNERTFIAENSENSRLLSSVASLPPVFPVYDENGDPFNNGLRTGVSYNGIELNPQAEFGNPVLGLTYADNLDVTNILFGNALMSWEFVEGLKLNGAVGALTRGQHVKNFGARFDIPDQVFTNPNNSLTETFAGQLFTQGEVYLTYEMNRAGGHSLSAVAGTSILANTLNTSGRFGLNFFPNSIEEVNFSNIISNDDKIVAPDYAEVNTTLSYYARANYNFQEKYLFSATLRADASSKFGPDNRWGIFPSVSAGWVLSSENFMANQALFSLLKLRGSWGVNGNDRIGPYQYADRYLRDGAGNLFQLDFNPGVKWEEISQANVGIDANLFSDQIGITLDFYTKTTRDMLLNFPNPSFLGLPPPVRNAASVQNMGIEALVLYRGRVGMDFKYTIGANAGFARNQITDLGGGLPIQGAGTRVFDGAPNLSLSDVGSPIASFYGFVFDGLDEQGNPVYRDLDGDGEVTPENDRTIIGNPYPTLIYRLDIRAEYKGFDLTVFASGSEGNDVVNASMGYGFQFSNRTTRVLDAWSIENPNSNVMRPSALEVTNHEFSDYYIEDGSYLRLRNVTLGYSLPASLLERAKIANLRVYVSGNNLVTFTQYSGYDPEIGANNSPLDVGVDRGFYPLARSFTGGVTVSF
ncbi:MAG: TonB-dependent receptor [Bacteroidota bacterium]